jgi:hypothetical protein
LQWSFGDGGPATAGGKQAAHRFAEAGKYWVKVLVLRGGALAFELALDVAVLPGRARRSLNAAALELLAIDGVVSLVALVVASLTGLLYLYADKPFGTLGDYAAAFLWGFGIDNGIRGIAAVFPKVTGSAGP